MSEQKRSAKLVGSLMMTKVPEELEEWLREEAKKIGTSMSNIMKIKLMTLMKTEKENGL